MPRNRHGQNAPRSAKGRGRGSHNGRPRGWKGRNSTLDIEYGAAFTLADEARETSIQDRTLWSTSTRLRNRPVSFVNGGQQEPLKILEHTQEQSAAGEGNKPATSKISGGGPLSEASTVEVIGDNVSVQKKTNVAEHLTEGPHNAIFFYDLKGSPVPVTGPHDETITGQTKQRSQSYASSSDEEKIIFNGRRGFSHIVKNSQTLENPSQSDIKVVEEGVKSLRVTRPTSSIKSLPKSVGASRRSASRRSRDRISRGSQENDDAAIADYIANIRENYSKSTDIMDSESRLRSFNHRSTTNESLPLKPTSEDYSEVSILSSRESLNAVSGMREPSYYEDQVASNSSAADAAGKKSSDETPVTFLTQKHPHPFLMGDPSPWSSQSEDLENTTLTQPEGSTASIEFDFMDWNRSSLSWKKRRKHRQMPQLDVSDSELEQKLQLAWKNDRLKKANRRKQREEMRALGLLGRQPGPQDLTDKYPTGMTAPAFEEELKAFLQGSDEILMFPPMDKHARKMIHELANKFNIKSKSTGKGDFRRPTLYRTGRTLPFVETSFEQAIGRVSRRYLPRPDSTGKRAAKAKAAPSGYAATSYRDGDIVGAAAPELSSENRGRAMLEKMGWSRGTALGSADNKGILHPVTHAMKRSKAGLG